MVTATKTVDAAGTSLADSSRVPPGLRSAPDAVWRSQRDRFFMRESRGTTRTTTVAGLLVHGSMISILAHAGTPYWRVAALITLYLVFVVAHALIMQTSRATRTVEQAFIGMNLAAQLFIVGSAALTGGVHSPFLPGAVLPSIVSLLFFGPQGVARWVALGNGLLIVAMVLLPREIVGAPLPDTDYTIAILINLTWSLFLLHLMVGKLSQIASLSGASMACLREERISEAEMQLRRLQSVGAKVAHELKNPLASIKGLCQLVSRTPESERTQERLAVVSSEISRMETILNEYLSFSRPLEDLKPEALDLTALARDVMDVLAGRADQANVTLALEGDATPVQGDPRRLKEALINLVANAIEATPSGGVVKLRVRGSKAEITLEVTDTGRGIAPEDLERLGTSFFTTRPNGTGLGVVLAQGVITQHGGSLVYASTIGQGTTATITLPGATQPSPEPSARAAMVEARA
ncbi:MAG: Sensor histidine kinase [Myxococcales bacterium]|nr:Sensor histidine kinase [Myxococcales bacterium]